MTNKLKTADILGLGFMTFAFFLGAGNIIFPPLAGSLAGNELTPAMLGFLVTAVGLPLLCLVAVAKAGGGLLTMGRYLPAGVATAFALAVYIIIGPSFATPRTGLVAYEIGVKPFLGETGATSLAVFSVLFFTLVCWLSVKPGLLLDNVGKIITPLLIVLLLALAVSVMLNPQGEIGAAQGEYVDHAFIKGFLEGYNTMDTFGALVFGMLIIDIIKSKGIEDKGFQYKYLIIAGTIAAAGLAFVYISLFYMGATSQVVAAGASNGGEIFSLYVKAMYGQPGQIVLSAVVGLACLTTAVGLVSAMSEFLVSLKPNWNYKLLVILNCVLCALVTNVGLSQLISLSVPVLFAVYPVAIMLVTLTFVQAWLPNKNMSYRFVIAVAFLFGLLDGIKVAGIDMQTFAFLPLFDKGLAWLLPSLIALLASFFIFKKNEQAVIAAADSA